MRVRPMIQTMALAAALATWAAFPAEPRAGEGEGAQEAEAERLSCPEQVELISDMEHEICQQRHFARVRAEAPWIYTAFREEVGADIHEEEADNIAANNRHVVMAYGGLWALVLAFVVFMWMRQERLKAEIARLEREVARAGEVD